MQLFCNHFCQTLLQEDVIGVIAVRSLYKYNPVYIF